MNYRLIHADVLDGLRQLPDESVQVCVTSPPYWGLRDYGVVGQLGLERTPGEYVARMCEVFSEVRRVLRADGTLWLNVGDSYSASQSNNGGYSAKSTLAGFTSPDTKGRRANDAGERRPLAHGCKPKDLVGIPWRLAFGLQSAGWYLRSDIIWSKPNPMPESVADRPTKAHEYLFLLTRSARYYYDADAIKEPSVTGDLRRPYGSEGAWDIDGRTSTQRHGGEQRKSDCDEANGRNVQKHNSEAERRDSVGSSFNNNPRLRPAADRNKRSVWTIATEPFPEAHFATFPTALVEPCILAGSRVGDTVLDPFNGSGTTGVVALSHQRSYVGIDLNADYIAMARRRLEGVAPMFATEIGRAI